MKYYYFFFLIEVKQFQKNINFDSKRSKNWRAFWFIFHFAFYLRFQLTYFLLSHITMQNVLDFILSTSSSFEHRNCNVRHRIWIKKTYEYRAFWIIYFVIFNSCVTWLCCRAHTRLYCKGVWNLHLYTLHNFYRKKAMQRIEFKYKIMNIDHFECFFSDI